MRVKFRHKVLAAAGAGAWLAFHGQVAGTVATLTSAPGGPVAANIALGQKLAAEDGWTGPEWTCLRVLWDGESGWRTNADTRVTGLTAPGQPYAFGIPQAYPGNKMAAVGPDWQTNPATQIKWGLGYIAGTYGNPCSALAAKRASGNKGY
jgi:hypothetical protein